MVRGLAVFREYFAGHADQFVLIGGTAATLAMEDAGLEFRATKDLDQYQVVESRSATICAALSQESEPRCRGSNPCLPANSQILHNQRLGPAARPWPPKARAGGFAGALQVTHRNATSEAREPPAVRLLPQTSGLSAKRCLRTTHP
jgi:hypothetical protein